MFEKQHHHLSQTVVGSPTGTYELSSYELLTRSLSCGTGRSRTNVTPITQECMPCLVGRYSSSQDPQLGKTDNGFHFPAACGAPLAV